jgi:hypothetical protein
LRDYSVQVEDTIDTAVTFRLGIFDAVELEADGCPGSVGLALDEGEASVLGDSMPVSFTVCPTWLLRLPPVGLPITATLSTPSRALLAIIPDVPVALGSPGFAAIVPAFSALMFSSTNEFGPSPARRHPVRDTVPACSDCEVADGAGICAPVGAGACADSPTAKAAAIHVHENARFIVVLPWLG